MKPHWDRLMKKFKKHETILIADVDCTADGKSLCATVGVQGYPTLKHGDPNSLEDYKGGRDYKDLLKFAKSLKPSCSPSNIDLCDDKQKAEIEEVSKLSIEELDDAIKEGEEKIKAAEKLFETSLEKLQAQYKKLSEEKEATIADVKKGGLSLKKSVRNVKKKAAKDAKVDADPAKVTTEDAKSHEEL